jgi:hypothetical protein
MEDSSFLLLSVIIMDQSHFELNQIIRQCLVHLLITSVFSYVQHNNLTSERKGRGKTEVP